jgi:hypothetical protein
MPEMPMSGVRSQLLPLQGALSTRSLAPAARTSGWLASMAKAGSFEPLGRYGVSGLPTVTLLSADTAAAVVGKVTTAASDTKGMRTAMRRVIVDSLSRKPDDATVLPDARCRSAEGAPIRDPLTSSRIQGSHTRWPSPGSSARPRLRDGMSNTQRDSGSARAFALAHFRGRRFPAHLALECEPRCQVPATKATTT